MISIKRPHSLVVNTVAYRPSGSGWTNFENSFKDFYQLKIVTRYEEKETPTVKFLSGASFCDLLEFIKAKLGKSFNHQPLSPGCVSRVKQFEDRFQAD